MKFLKTKLSLAPLNQINKSIIILLIILTFSLFIINSDIRGGSITICFNNINYNSILILISKICFWFSIGIKLYLNISEGK